MRQSLMDATAQLLATRRLWAIKVSDIAAACGVRPPNFYAYFDSVDEVILALAEQANAEHPDIARLIDYDWMPQDALATAQMIIALTVEHWAKYRPVLKVVNMMADDGEPAFARARIARLRPVVQAFRRRIEAAQAIGAVSPHLDARLAAYSLATRIEQSGYSWNLIELSGAGHEDALETLGLLMVGAVRELRLYPHLSQE